MKTTPASYNPDLTPQNAFQKGFQYIDDIIYDVNNYAMQDIFKLINQFNYQLGTPSKSNNSFPYFGLYAPNTRV